MQKLHELLEQHSSSYKKWHEHPHRNAHHFGVFLAIAAITAATALSGIKSLALSYDEIAAYQSGYKPTAQTNGKSDQHLPELTTQLLSAIKAFQKTSAADRQFALSNLKAAAQTRQQTMLSETETNPQEVLLSALPASVTAHMPVEIASFVEQKVEEKGKIKLIHIDCPSADMPQIPGCEEKLLFSISTPRGEVSLHFAEDPTGESISSNFVTGDYVKATGVEIGDKMALTAQDLQNTTVSAQALPNVFGPQKTLVVLVNFLNNTSTPYSTTTIANQTFQPGTDSIYWMNNSYQQTSMVGDVAGWYTIPVTASGCPTSAIQNYGLQAAQANGFTLSNYNHFLFEFPSAGCNWWGMSYVGGSPSYSWVEGTYTLTVVDHELGHALSLYHSHSLSCTNTSGAPVVYNNGSSGCTMSEYGDIYDIMGGGTQLIHHYNAFQKERLGWLNYNTQPPIQTITTSGNYTISPVDVQDNNVKAIKILQSSGTSNYYYIEYRSGMSGVLLHIGALPNANSSDLLNAGAVNKTGWPLGVGQSYTDAAIGVTFTTVSTGSTGAVVNVNYGVATCIKAKPTVSVSPVSQSGQAGQTLKYTVTVSNNDTSACSSAAFTASISNLPAGFNYSAGSMSLAPGTSGNVLLSVTSPSGYPDSSNTFTIATYDTSDASHSNTAQATYVVFTDAAVPTVAITSPTNGAVLSKSASVTISVSASDNVGVTKVEIYIDGKLTVTDTTSPYSYKWNIKNVSAGSHTITAKAYDAAGNMGTASITVTK